MPKRKLQDNNVVITGGGGGLGAALGQEFVYSGCNVALLDIDYERAVLAADQISGGRAVPIACDVTSQESCSQALSQASAELGPIDILVNNAGLAHRSPFAETDIAVLERIMNINFWGSAMCTKLALQGIIERRGGHRGDNFNCGICAAARPHRICGVQARPPRPIPPRLVRNCARRGSMSWLLLHRSSTPRSANEPSVAMARSPHTRDRR